jgi:sterol desaturase/sphingolipid hydroxylase (fatty acid hydroxylase superfamily)
MDFPNLIHFAIPFFVGFILLELIISAYQKTKNYEAKDAFSSIAMGLGNVLIGLVGKGLVLGAYTLVHQWAPLSLGYAWWVWILAFFAEDLTYYFYHRNAHNIRYFWASHVIHHSSQHYNLSTALRQTWTGIFSGSFVFWLWLPLLGFEPLMILFLQSISLLYQFWIHTEVVNKLPSWFEFLFNTPSHHRVHHASNIKYLDKNHAGVLIIWDRMFGTFKAEEERPTYGLTANIKTFNPLHIATHEWVAIFRDLQKHPKHSMGYLFGPPGWSHDGSRRTTAQLREAISMKPQKAP